MVWDLQGAMIKKQERETARLMDFDFRHRVRTARILARELGMDEDDLVRTFVIENRVVEVRRRIEEARRSENDAAKMIEKARMRARTELVAELGDPAPYQMI